LGINLWADGNKLSNYIYLNAAFCIENGYKLNNLKSYIMKHIFFIYFCLLNNCIIAQSIIYVNQNATGKNDGTSWQDAFKDLHEALENKDKDTLYIAEGTYYPTKNNNRAESFNISHLSYIKGGFGLENGEYVYNPIKFAIILSGDIGNKLDTTDNSFHILIYKPSIKTEVAIIGLNVQNSNCIKEAATNNSGGGLLVDNINSNSDIRINIHQCSFERNIASSGGAITIKKSKYDYSILPNILNSIFKSNTSGYSGGGAIYFSNITNKIEDTVIIKNCQFYRNLSFESGGGLKFEEIIGTIKLEKNKFEFNQSAIEASISIYIRNNLWAKFVIDSSEFNNNTSNSGNISIYKFDKVSENDSLFIYISNSKFQNNIITTNEGGALDLYNYVGYCSLKINNCMFDKNLAQNDGGVFFIENGYEFDLNINNCIFSNNKVNSNQGFGVLFYRSNLLNNSIIDKTRININNSLFYNNKDCFGILNGIIGTIDTKITNCTFFNNGQYVFSKYYDKIPDYTTFYSKMTIQNSVIWEKTPIELLLFNGNYLKLSINDFILKNNNINLPNLEYKNINTDFGGNILLKYPQFKDTLNNDFSLLPCSPAINKGNRYIIDSLGILFDLVGNPRMYQDSVDIGAYESQKECMVANQDLDYDELFKLMPNLTYPNATIQLQMNTANIKDNYQFRIIDISGKWIATYNANLQTTFDAPPNSGLYFVQLISENAIVGVAKLVVVE